MGHQHTNEPELPIMYWVSVEPSSHKAECTQQYQMTRLALTRKAKLHEDITQMFTVPITATIPSCSQPVPMASGVVPYNSLTEKEKIQAWFAAVSLFPQDTQASSGGAQRLHCIPLYGTIREAVRERKPSYWLARHSTPGSSLLRGMTRHVVLWRAVGCGCWFGWMVRDLGGT